MQPAMKRSRQRDAILTFLSTRSDHPTADVIYMNIRQEFPNISLGTVYRNLALLSEHGHILKLSYEAGPDRYDACVEPHYHFICKECGKIVDLKIDSMDEKVSKMADSQFPGDIEESIIYFKGICPECKKNKKSC